MKTLLTIFIASSLLGSCATFQSAFNDQTITTAVSVATSAGLRYAVKDSTKRTTIANYIDTYAGALRTITGSPTADQLTTQINAFIPSNIKSDVPELVAFVVPIVVSNYQVAYQKYGANAKQLYQVLNDIATGLESGAANYAK